MTRSEFSPTDRPLDLISEATLEWLGVTKAPIYFDDLECTTAALVFPHPDGAWKARGIDDEVYAVSPNLRPGFWNLDRVLRGIAAGETDRVYVVQAELNACALVEAGIAPDAVLSVTSASGNDESDFVRAALKAGLAKASIIWCGNQDAAGLALRAHMAKAIGVARFGFVDWPEGVLNALEVLQAEGGEGLLDRVQNGSMPWPVAGLFRISELPEPPKLTLWSPGFLEWENKVQFAPGPCQLSPDIPATARHSSATKSGSASPKPTTSSWRALRSRRGPNRICGANCVRCSAADWSAICPPRKSERRTRGSTIDIALSSIPSSAQRWIGCLKSPRPPLSARALALSSSTHGTGSKVLGKRARAKPTTSAVAFARFTLSLTT